MVKIKNRASMLLIYLFYVILYTNIKKSVRAKNPKYLKKNSNKRFQCI